MDQASSCASSSSNVGYGSNRRENPSRRTPAAEPRSLSPPRRGVGCFGLPLFDELTFGVDIRDSRLEGGSASVLETRCFQRVSREPSNGLEPLTPSLPWRLRGGSAGGRDARFPPCFRLSITSPRSVPVASLSVLEHPWDDPNMSPKPVPKGVILSVLDRASCAPLSAALRLGGRIQTPGRLIPR